MRTINLFYRRFLNIARRSPDDAYRILHIAGLATVEALAEEVARGERYLESTRERHGVRRPPSIEAQAAELSIDAQMVYAQVYAFLLSDQVHMGAGDAVAPMLAGRGTPGEADLKSALITARDLTSEMITLIRRATRQMA